jgi:hypothetical protein
MPAQWVNIDRSRVKDSVNVIWWLSKSDTPKADNRNVLTPYSKDMERLLQRQSYNGGRRPGGTVVNPESWKRRHDGAIPSNTLQLPFDEQADESTTPGLTSSASGARNQHPGTTARSRRWSKPIPMTLPRYENELASIRPVSPRRCPSSSCGSFTENADLVVDPFAGSNVTGKVAATLGRRWASFELHRYYLEPSIARFDEYPDGYITTG